MGAIYDCRYDADASAVIDELERRGLLAKDANEDGGYLPTVGSGV